MRLLRRLWRDEQGQDLVEYALLLVLIALALTVGMRTLGCAISNVFSNAGANMTVVTT
jgi:pilus assembly protein Flp/PilA